MGKTDEKDKELINLLISNPGLTQTQLGEKLGVTKLTINNRIKRLKQNKTLLYTYPVFDLKKLGYDQTAIIHIQIKNGKTKEAIHKWAKDPNVTAAYDTTGQYDIILIAKFHNTHELDQWNKKLLKDTEYVERVNTSLAFSNPKEGTNPNKIE